MQSELSPKKKKKAIPPPTYEVRMAFWWGWRNCQHRGMWRIAGVMGHRVRYIGSLFRVDELVPVIHSLWFTEREMKKSKIYRQNHWFTTTGEDTGNSGGRRGLLLDSYQTRKEKHPCFNTKTVKKRPQNPTINRLCLHSASAVTLYQSRCKTT